MSILTVVEGVGEEAKDNQHSGGCGTIMTLKVHEAEDDQYNSGCGTIKYTGHESTRGRGRPTQQWILV